MSRQLWEHLLQLDITALMSAGSLPGCIPLYVGMPVILQTRNLCMDLGVANGSQGIIKHIYTAICEFGFTYCTCALVEFPTSWVAIPGLPAGIFPVTPISWSFMTLLPSSFDPSTKVRVTQNQLAIQPSFAVTGHSAQGKTLPNVIVDLHEGGFGVYVAASRCG
jgi:ATP-dependent exoDNAse (exonuclease V) alpha subunit